MFSELTDHRSARVVEVFGNCLIW